MNSFVVDVQSRLNALLSAVANADRAIMDVYESRSAVVQYKTDDTPVTQADLASHHIITACIASQFPDTPIVSEEGQAARNTELVRTPLFWLIDPLDGTAEFLARTDQFTVCVALIEQGRPVFGIVSAPALGVTYYGGAGMGSFKLTAQAAAQPIHISTEPLRVVLTSRSNQNESTAAYIDQHYPGFRAIGVGSQLKLPWISEGVADVYPSLARPLHLWDLAAGHAILEAAGGTVRRPDNTVIDYRRPDLRVGDFVATSGTSVP